MKKKKNYYFISNKTNSIQRLTSSTNLQDIHRAFIFDNIQKANLYYTRTYNTILDFGKSDDIYSTVIERQLNKKLIQIKDINTYLELNEKNIPYFLSEKKILLELKSNFELLKAKQLINRIQAQEKLAYIWEHSTKKDFSPFVSHIYNELTKELKYLKNFPEAISIVQDWKISDNKFNESISNTRNKFISKLNKISFKNDKIILLEAIDKINKIKTSYITNKIQIALSTPRPNDFLNKYKITDIPLSKCKFDGFGYNIIAIKNNKIRRVRFIIETEDSYKLITTDGLFFDNNTTCIMDDFKELDWNDNLPFAIDLKKPVYQCKTTVDKKVRNIE